jgi:beta-1,4-mannosyltransferase
MNKSLRVAVVVFGDVGRSPRMQYHTDSLSKLKQVESIDLIGYQGSDLIDSVKQKKSIL